MTSLDKYPPKLHFPETTNNHNNNELLPAQYSFKI